MIPFFIELKRRNGLLYWFGILNAFAAAFCAVMIVMDNNIVLGINAWIKPLKFYTSILLFSWTMGWLLEYLQMPRRVQYYSVMVVLVMIFEMAIITWQAANGRLSHFNLSTSLYAILFSMMGLAITLLAVWTAYIAFLFFKKKSFTVPLHFIWSIRLGLIIFVIFSFEGGLMASHLSHSVGGPDGSSGLPLLNWNRRYGDLRVAHFFGMHALQVIPLVAWFFMTQVKQVIIFALLYFLIVTAVFVQALFGMPLI